MTENVLDRLERLHRESTEDGGNQSFQIMQGGIYINELEVNAPNLIAAARALGGMLWVYDNTVAKPGGYSTAHVQIEQARAAWEKVTR